MTPLPPQAMTCSQFWQRTHYRLSQFFRGLHAQVTPDEEQLVQALLPPAALALFAEMPLDAKRHAINVLYAVRQAGFDQPELAIAALLHDVGKNAAAQAGIRLGLWLRGPLVILEALGAAGVRRLGSPDPQQRWRYLLFVHFEHPAIGAQWAAQADCPAVTCWLIKHHQEKAPTAPNQHHLLLLQALQNADGSN